MFKEIPANKSSISRRKPVEGVAVNDANYVVSPIINGKRVVCPFYCKWHSMITRCYSEKEHLTNPTYKDCSVCEEWLTFSNFKAWMIKQDWRNKELDKDILNQGNKVYSPRNCIFVSREINALVNDNKASRGELPLGVCFDRGKYKVQHSDKKENKYIGRFDNKEDAFKAYKKHKTALIHSIAMKQIEPIKSALLNFEVKS